MMISDSSSGAEDYTRDQFEGSEVVYVSSSQCEEEEMEEEEELDSQISENGEL